MWLLETWFTGGLASVRLMAALNDLNVLFQPKCSTVHCSFFFFFLSPNFKRSSQNAL